MVCSNETVSETQTKPQGRKPKISKLAIVAMVLGVLSLCRLWISEPSGFVRPAGYVLSVLALQVAAIVGIGLGLAAIVRINMRSNGMLRGRRFAIVGIAAAAISLVLGILGLALLRKPQYGMICGTNLSGLGKAMAIYANDYDGKYPTADKWCDLLLQGDYVNEKQFVCRAARDSGDNERCHYAINPNCKPNSPPDLVLLFETKGSWNRFGGPEILTTENHGGKGCNILFNDGRVEFVETKDLGKLKWKVEEGKEKPGVSQ